MYISILLLLLIIAAALVLGAFIGVGLGRRSKTANATVDRIRAEYSEKLQAARDEVARLRNQD